MSDERWDQVFGYVERAVPDDGVTLVVGGAPEQARVLADRLAARFGAARVVRPAERFEVARVGDGDGLLLWASGGRGDRREDADVVVDVSDPAWPVIRHIDAALLDRDVWFGSESRAFFAARAATWDSRFGDDMPAYGRAVAEAGLAPGWTVVDLGCGTGRAFPGLREAVGDGVVIGVDHTPEMLDAARVRARECGASLVLGDARRLPFRDGGVAAVFAAGLLTHLPDPEGGLRELARVTAPGGRLVLFHPTGRAALAARHGHTLRPDEPLNEDVLRVTGGHAGWDLIGYDDRAHRFHAVLARRA
ncbi:class I SAM-dependent methyltransferase [Winogradskya humida]|uniref:Methyltransferase type 11 domain-containing protein n=1 Tax=Winogradskya humida TaxID=113566 RepID=A0ABQ4A5V8_9ACTN|nr:methyltransferase domain-containing protein [Actinoplanes humidus]GIE26237.1 hypothetical protein Ahu01nite_093390 [Actinoplanes humidus]